MAIKINKLEIRNFRSSRALTVAPGRLAVLVGKNDSGKSNVLRALNLFFNGETDSGQRLRFDVDHNVFNQPNRRAKEIAIRLEIELPESYRQTNGDLIVWEKRWRSEGLVHNAYHGIRWVEGQRGAIKQHFVAIPDRSNVHTLLRNIHFIYVPAIKDLRYFSELRASIYGVISEVADRTFRDSSRDFERSISVQLQDLTAEIANSLSFQSRLALPRDLSHIFESLDFLSEGENISLDARGDGVKARHIPLILKFMADKLLGLQVRGAPPHSFIWGYEEPENNLEMASCVELADQFKFFLEDGIGQIFLTTHSPVFYNLQNTKAADDGLVSSHHVYRDSDEDGTEIKAEVNDLDERMGTMSALAPVVKGLEARVRQRERARVRARVLAASSRRKLFVEGPSDRAIIRKALRVFAPDRAGEIDVETRSQGAGYRYVIDMLMGWSAVAKHTPRATRAAGLVDLDPRAKTAADNWNAEVANVRYAKCITLSKPGHILPALQAGFRVPVVLETLYDRDAWEWAEDKGYLVDRVGLPSIVPQALLQELLVDGSLVDHLDAGWDIYVLRQFHHERKRSMARHFARKTNVEFRERLASLEVVVDNIISYLFPVEGSAQG